MILFLLNCIILTYPLLDTYNHLMNDTMTNHWVIFWTIYSIITLLEQLIGWLPLYSWIKVILIFILQFEYSTNMLYIYVNNHYHYNINDIRKIPILNNTMIYYDTIHTLNVNSNEIIKKIL